MNDLTPEQRARALGAYRAYMSGVGHAPAATERTTLSDMEARAWLAVDAHVLASHACPDPNMDERVSAWDRVARHPFFAECYQTEGTLVDAMLAKLDAAHECPTAPVWRPVIDGEDLTGHEVRARSNDADWWGAWGVAYRRNGHGNWVTKGGAVLTGGWPVAETTAPLPEPEPWDDDTLDEWEDSLRASIDLDAGWTTSTRQLLNLLASRGLIERPKAGA